MEAVASSQDRKHGAGVIMDAIGKFFNWLFNTKPALIILAVLGAVLGFKAVQWKARMDGEEHERKKQKIETAKERERVIETSHQIIEEIEDAKDAAIAAPDTVPVVSSADELRREAPAIAKVILRDRR